MQSRRNKHFFLSCCRRSSSDSSDSLFEVESLDSLNHQAKFDVLGRPGRKDKVVGAVESAEAIVDMVRDGGMDIRRRVSTD